MLSRFSRHAAGTAATALVAGTVVLTGASSASAQVCSPFPSCVGKPYHPASYDNNLAEWNGRPLAPGSAIVGYVTNAQTLWVVCQANNGPTSDGELSNTWDFAWSAYAGRYVWVYDYWMSTPQIGSNGYSPGIDHCNF
jgi:hypothetical protein